MNATGDLEYIRDVFTHLEDMEGYDFNYHIEYCKNYNLYPDPNIQSIPHYISLTEKCNLIDSSGSMSYRGNRERNIHVNRSQHEGWLHPFELQDRIHDEMERMDRIYSIIDKLIDQIKDKCEFSLIKRSFMPGKIYVEFYYQ